MYLHFAETFFAKVTVYPVYIQCSTVYKHWIIHWITCDADRRRTPSFCLKKRLVRRSASPVIYNICCVYVVYVLCISSGFPLDSKGKVRAPCIYSGLKMFFLFLKRMLPESTRYTMDMLRNLC